MKSLFAKTNPLAAFFAKKIPFFRKKESFSKLNSINSLAKKENLFSISQKKSFFKKVFPFSTSVKKGDLLLLSPREPLLFLDQPPLIYSKEKIYLSGLASLDYSLLQKKEVLIEYYRLLNLMIARILFFFFSEKFFHNYPLLKIEQILSQLLLFTNQKSLNGAIFEEILAKRWGALSQHIINYFLFIIKIPKNFVQDNYPEIDLSSHEKVVSLGLITEIYFCKKALFFQDNSYPHINIESINHDNQEIQENNKTIIFDSNSSNLQTGQPFSDFLFYQFLIDKDFNITLQRYNKDVKANYRGISKGHLTIIPGLTRNSKKMINYINDIITFLNTKKLQLSPEQQDLKKYIENLMIYLETIRKDQNLSLEKKLKEINSFLFNIYCSDLGLLLNDNGINITLCGDIEEPFLDQDFIDFSKKVEILIENEINTITIAEISKIIPNNNMVTLDNSMNLLKEIIQTKIPEDFRKEIWENLHKSINL